MHRSLLVVAAAVVCALPLTACSSGSESSGTSWEDEYRQAMIVSFDNAEPDRLDESCQTIASEEVDDAAAYVDYLKANAPAELTLDNVLASLQADDPAPDLAEIVPDDATVDEVLTITGEVHLETCASRD